MVGAALCCATTACMPSSTSFSEAVLASVHYVGFATATSLLTSLRGEVSSRHVELTIVADKLRELINTQAAVIDLLGLEVSSPEVPLFVALCRHDLLSVPGAGPLPIWQICPIPRLTD